MILEAKFADNGYLKPCSICQWGDPKDVFGAESSCSGSSNAKWRWSHYRAIHWWVSVDHKRSSVSPSFAFRRGYRCCWWKSVHSCWDMHWLWRQFWYIYAFSSLFLVRNLVPEYCSSFPSKIVLVLSICFSINCKSCSVRVRYTYRSNFLSLSFDHSNWPFTCGRYCVVQWTMPTC